MTTLVRWEPFRDITQLQGEMSRRMNGLLEGSQGRTTPQSWVPALDVWETDSELVCVRRARCPGERITIEAHDDTLTVSGEREQRTQEQGDRFYRFERRYSSFARGVGLPAGVDVSKITASYENGVLELHMPKPEEAKPRRIQSATGARTSMLKLRLPERAETASWRAASCAASAVSRDRVAGLRPLLPDTRAVRVSLSHARGSRMHSTSRSPRVRRLAAVHRDRRAFSTRRRCHSSQPTSPPGRSRSGTTR